MKKYFFTAAFLLLSVSVFSKEEVLDRVVAVINDEVILLSELEELLASTIVQDPSLRGMPVGRRDSLKTELLDRVIEEKILVAQARADSITVSEEWVSQMLDDHMGKILSQYKSQEELDRVLKQTLGINLLQYKNRLRQQFEDKYLSEHLKSSIMQKLSATPSEVTSFYEKHKNVLPGEENSINFSMIMVKTGPDTSVTNKAYRKIKSIRDSIQSGEADFSDMALRYSEDPASAESGGDLGYFNKGTFNMPDFESAAFSLSPGELSGIIKSKLGFHILKVSDRKGEAVRASHILLRITASEKNIKQKKTLLDSIRENAVNSEDFAKAAEKYSEAHSARRGGSLGWVSRGDLEYEYPDYASTLEDLEAGQISEPVLIDEKLYIFRINEEKDLRPLSLKHDREKIERFALQEKVAKRMQELVEERRKKMYIEKKL
ncbi:MAG: peptidylprolyl isomerase [Fibrobacterota bacterium]